MNNATLPKPVTAQQKAEVKLRAQVDQAVRQRRISADQGNKVMAKQGEITKFEASIEKLSRPEQFKARAEKQRDIFAWAMKNKISYSFVFALTSSRN